MNNAEWCKKNCPYHPDCGGGGVCNFVISLLDRWISVDDMLPEDSTRVLVANRSGVNVACYNGRYWERGASNKHIPLTTVTHWMPLPEPPENGR